MADIFEAFKAGIPEDGDRGEWVLTVGPDDDALDYAYQGQGVPARVYYGHAVRVRIGDGVPRLGQDDINHLKRLVEGVRGALKEGDEDALFESIKDAEDFLESYPCDFVADYDWCWDAIIEGATAVLNGEPIDSWLDENIPEREYIDGAYVIYDKADLKRWILRRAKEEQGE